MTAFLSLEQIKSLQDILNYTFKDEALLNRAFEAASSSSTPEGNKRLALLGRSLLSFLLNLKSFEQNLAVVEMNTRLSGYCAASRLTGVGFTRSLHRFIRMNPAASMTNRVSDRLMALTMEALLAAVFLDCQRDLSITCDFAFELGIL